MTTEIIILSFILIMVYSANVCITNVSQINYKCALKTKQHVRKRIAPSSAVCILAYIISDSEPVVCYLELNFQTT